jgi:feruloyl esterase
MNHCGGGPSTDNFDAFLALREWVELHHAPDAIIATAGAQSPWPGRTRPLCPYPKVARYKGHGDPESQESFECGI